MIHSTIISEITSTHLWIDRGYSFFQCASFIIVGLTSVKIHFKNENRAICQNNLFRKNAKLKRYVLKFITVLLGHRICSTGRLKFRYSEKAKNSPIFLMLQYALDLRKILGVAKKFLKSRSFLFQTLQNP